MQVQARPCRGEQVELGGVGRLGTCPPALGVPARGLWPRGSSSHVTPALLFPAEKKMMSSASAAGTQQIYSQGSPFPAGHSGKAFRYVQGWGEGREAAGDGRSKGREDAPSPGKPGLSELGPGAANPQTSASEWPLVRAEDSGGWGSALRPPRVATDTWCCLPVSDEKGASHRVL